MMTRTPHLPIAGLLLAALLSLAVCAPADAAVPKTLLVDGVLTSAGGGAAADGVYQVTFALYSVKSGGTAVWSEGPLPVAIKEGRFSQALGLIKPFAPAILDPMAAAWLGLKVGDDPELPRMTLRSVAYALLAESARSLACSGCVTGSALAKGAVGAEQVGFTYAGAKTKGGPANLAADLQCSGCVSVGELKIDKDLDLGGNALKAKAVSATTVTATMFQGDGSKLTGIKIPSGDCKVNGEVVKGINPDGSLKCVKAMDPSGLPADGIDEISNNLIHNQFQNIDCMAKAVPIPDNNPIGIGAEVIFGDYGLAQKLDVQIDLANSDLSTVTVTLWDPNNVKYSLWDKSGPGKTLSGVWPSKNKTLSGDLTTWVNKNPKGKWRIQVTDGKFLNNGNDGAINKFCVHIQTLSNQKIEVQGDLLVGTEANKRKLVVNGDVEITGSLKIGPQAQPWQLHFPAGSRPFLYGYYEDHLDNNIQYGSKYNVPHDIPVDIRSLHLSTRSIVWGDDRGNIHIRRGGDNYGNGSSDQSQIVLVAFIKNTTGASIKHTAYLWGSSRGTNNNHGGVAINKGNVWYHGGNWVGQTNVSLTFPANKTSVLVMKMGQYQWTTWNGTWNRIMAGWYNDTWSEAKMPKGLEWDYAMYWQWMKGG